MKHQTLVNAWALFGVFWFITFAILTFVSQGLSLLAIITALSFYAGMVLAAISIAQLLLDIIKPKSGKPKTESITRHSRKKTKTGQTESKSTSQAPQ